MNCHIDALLNIDHIQKGNPTVLKEFVSTVKQHTGSLKMLKQPVEGWDVILVRILPKK